MLFLAYNNLSYLPKIHRKTFKICGNKSVFVIDFKSLSTILGSRLSSLTTNPFYAKGCIHVLLYIYLANMVHDMSHCICGFILDMQMRYLFACFYE